MLNREALVSQVERLTIENNILKTAILNIEGFNKGVGHDPDIQAWIDFCLEQVYGIKGD